MGSGRIAGSSRGRLLTRAVQKRGSRTATVMEQSTPNREKWANGHRGTWADTLIPGRVKNSLRQPGALGLIAGRFPAANDLSCF